MYKRHTINKIHISHIGAKYFSHIIYMYNLRQIYFARMTYKLKQREYYKKENERWKM